MELEKLFKAADEKLAEFPDAKADTWLHWIKENLKDIWFLKDMNGMGQPVAEDIARAIVNLCCLGRLLKVDLKATLDHEYGTQNGPETQPEAKDKEAKPQAATAAKPEEKPASTEAKAEAPKAPAPAPPSAPTPAKGPEAPESAGDKQAIMAMYERELRACKSRADADKIWKKDITVDKRLAGMDKVTLQKIYNEVKKALAA